MGRCRSHLVRNTTRPSSLATIPLPSICHEFESARMQPFGQTFSGRCFVIGVVLEDTHGDGTDSERDFRALGGEQRADLFPDFMKQPCLRVGPPAISSGFG